MDCHIVRERYLAGVLEPLVVTSRNPLADVFTKPLGVERFSWLIQQLVVINTYRVPAYGWLSNSKEESDEGRRKIQKGTYDQGKGIEMKKKEAEEMKKNKRKIKRKGGSKAKKK